MGLYPFGKGVQFCGSHSAIAWPAESSAPASTAPSNSRGQKGRCPPGPESMQPCWESTQGILVVGWPRDWSGKETAGGCGEVGSDRRCDRELCAPRAPSCPWHEAKHGRAPAGRPYPWPPPTCQKPEPEGQRGFMSRDVLKELSKVSKKQTSRITRGRNRAFLNKSSEKQNSEAQVSSLPWGCLPFSFGSQSIVSALS